MKKVVLLIIAVVCVFQAYAQNVDSLQAQSAAATIDSLSLRLDKLQHDFDFMSCDYQLNKHLLELTNLSQDISNSTNSVLINVFNGRYDRALYTAYSESYDAYSSNYDALKEKFETLQTWAMYKVVSSNFSDTEFNVIDVCLNAIKSGFATVDAALNTYDVAIQGYRDKR